MDIAQLLSKSGDKSQAANNAHDGHTSGHKKKSSAESDEETVSTEQRRIRNKWLRALRHSANENNKGFFLHSCLYVYLHTRIPQVVYCGHNFLCLGSKRKL